MTTAHLATLTARPDAAPTQQCPFMSMVCGLDVHRGQITFDALVLESGESWRGRSYTSDSPRSTSPSR